MSKARCCLPFCFLVSFDKSSTLVPPDLAKGEFAHDKRGVWSSGRSDRSIDWGQDGPVAQPVPPPPNKRRFLRKREVRLPFAAAVIAGRAWLQTGTGKVVYIASGVFVSGFRFQPFQHSNKSV